MPGPGSLVGIPTPIFDGLEEILVGRRPGWWHVACYYDDNGTPEPNGWAGCHETWEVVAVVSSYLGVEDKLKSFLSYSVTRGVDVYYDTSPSMSCFFAYAYQAGPMGYQGWGTHDTHIGAMMEAILSFFDEAAKLIDPPVWGEGS